MNKVFIIIFLFFLCMIDQIDDSLNEMAMCSWENYFHLAK